MPSIDRASILIMATHGFEQSELMTPEVELLQRGAAVDIASPDGEPIRGWNGDDWGEEVQADLAIRDVRVEDYDALVLPGGQINPDTLRTVNEAVALVRSFVERGRVVAAICHAPWLLIEAGVAKGREMTSYASIRTDVRNAGATWVDREVVVSNGIITSRSPDDLPAFVAKIVEEVEEGRHERPAA